MDELYLYNLLFKGSGLMLKFKKMFFVVAMLAGANTSGQVELDQQWSPMKLGDIGSLIVDRVTQTTSRYILLEKGINQSFDHLYAALVDGAIFGKVKVPCSADDIEGFVDFIPPSGGSVPFGDVAELQSIGLLPVYNETSVALSPDLSIVWNGMAGERGEIGLFPAQHAAFIAGQTDLLFSILEVAKKPPASNISHGHKPNLYWLPFLMTGDVQYVRNMEQTWGMFKQWRPRGLDAWMQGRNLAWTLRDLAQLAWLQEQGFTESDVYISTLSEAREFYLSKQENNFHDTWRVLGFNWVDSTSLGWTSWMESFVGQSLAHTVRLGHDWKPIAEWHFQHLVRRSGSEWPFKAIDADHVFFRWFCGDQKLTTCAYALTWQDVTPYQPTHTGTEDYNAYPDDQLLPYKLNGHRFTFANRAQYAYGWAALAASVGIEGAHEKAQQLKAAIDGRGDTFEIKNNFKVPQ